MALNTWHHIQITLDPSGGSQVRIDDAPAGNLLSTAPSYGGSQDWVLTLGNFDGEIDELRIGR
jgi:hypothetical protein